MSSELKYRTDIDGLRAIAVLSVVIYHAFPSLLSGGFIGVDIFFVISGYLISLIIYKQLLENCFSFKNFYIKRINRIFPSLIIVLITSYLFGWFALFSEEFNQLSLHILGGAGFVSNIVLWKESGYFDISSDLKPLLHLWSLAVEEQFYIIWPVFLYSTYKYVSGKKILIPIILLAFCSFLLNINLIQHHAVSTFYLLPTRFWELLIGSYLAHNTVFKNDYIIKLNFKIKTENLKSIVGIIFIIIAAFTFNKNHLFPGYRALFPTFGSLFLISAGPNAWINRKVFSHPLLVQIGLISYPLYLWHWPIFSFLKIVNYGEVASSILRFFAILISFILSWLTYILLEKPIRANKKNKLSAYLLCSIMAIIALLGSYTFNNSPARIGLSIKNLEMKKKEFASDRIFKNECVTELKTKNLDYCLLTKKGEPPTVLLIGDSHANALYFGLANIFKDHGENLLNIGHGGCLPFFNTESAQIGSVEICHNLMNDSLQYAIDSTNIKTIILASRGPIYITGKGFEEPEVNRYIKYSNAPDYQQFSEVFKASMTATLTRLVKTQKKIIYFIDYPELGFNPLLCLEPRIFSSVKKHKDPCDINLEAVKKRNELYLTIIKSVLKSFPTVSVFNQSQYLCNDSSCHALIDGKILYRDSDHLSNNGSIFMSEKFRLEYFKK